MDRSIKESVQSSRAEHDDAVVLAAQWPVLAANLNDCCCFCYTAVTTFPT